MINGEIRRISALTVEEINQHAKESFEHGRSLHDCPFPADTHAATRWRIAYMAMCNDQDDEFINPRVKVLA